jgi:hypothetical protein
MPIKSWRDRGKPRRRPASLLVDTRTAAISVKTSEDTGTVAMGEARQRLQTKVMTKDAAVLAGMARGTLSSRVHNGHTPHKAGQRMTLAQALCLMTAERLRELGFTTSAACAIGYGIENDWTNVLTNFPRSTFLVVWRTKGGPQPYGFNVLSEDELRAKEADGSLPNPRPAGVVTLDLAAIWAVALERGASMGLMG